MRRGPRQGGRAGSGRRRPAGFTLIEVVIVMAVIGILAAIAVPAYVEHVRRGHRNDARSTLLLAAQFMERVRTEAGSYADAVLPPDLSRSPAIGKQQFAVTVAATAVGYTLTAAPASGGMMVGDKCSTITLDQSGLRGFTSSNGGTLQYCWQR